MDTDRTADGVKEVSRRPLIRLQERQARGVATACWEAGITRSRQNLRQRHRSRRSIAPPNSSSHTQRHPALLSLLNSPTVARKVWPTPWLYLKATRWHLRLPRLVACHLMSRSLLSNSLAPVPFQPHRHLLKRPLCLPAAHMTLLPSTERPMAAVTLHRVVREQRALQLDQPLPPRPSSASHLAVQHVLEMK